MQCIVLLHLSLPVQTRESWCWRLGACHCRTGMKNEKRQNRRLSFFTCVAHKKLFPQRCLEGKTPVWPPGCFIDVTICNIRTHTAAFKRQGFHSAVWITIGTQWSPPPIIMLCVLLLHRGGILIFVYLLHLEWLLVCSVMAFKMHNSLIQSVRRMGSTLGVFGNNFKLFLSQEINFIKTSSGCLQ